MGGRRSQNNQIRNGLHTVMNAVMAIVAACALFFAVFGLWLVPERVSGTSMEPTFHNDEILLVSRLSKHLRTPRRGDVVFFRDPDGDGFLIRRIVALPGETVEVVGGKVYIDSCPLDESAYLTEEVPAGDSPAVTVPEGAYYVLGDNRSETYDSRVPAFGCVETGEILGIVRLRISPLSEVTYYA